MSVSFRLLTDADVTSVLELDDLIDAMTITLKDIAAGSVQEPARTIVSLAGVMILIDSRTRGLLALLDSRCVTTMRTAAVSAVSSRLLARRTTASLAIIGADSHARSQLAALRRVHRVRHVAIWGPSKEQREQFAADATGAVTGVKTVDHPGEAIVGADVIVLAAASSTVIESGWVKPGAHLISTDQTEREIDPNLVARARLFEDAELGQIAAGSAAGRRSDSEITIFKSRAMAEEDAAAADLAYRRAVERGVGRELAL